MDSFSNDSRSMTWHQWHAEYPIDKNTGLSSARAFANASSPHGYQSTGLCACWRRYGEVSFPRRFMFLESMPTYAACAAKPPRYGVRAARPPLWEGGGS